MSKIIKKHHYHIKGLYKILTPLTWLLGGVLHIKGNEDFSNILGNGPFDLNDSSSPFMYKKVP